MRLDGDIGTPWPTGRTGIFIVTPIKLYSDGIAHFLRSSTGLVVLGTAETGDTAIGAAGRLCPDVILLDMALDDSRATARGLRAVLPDVPIVALAIPESESHVVGCAEAGMSAYVARDQSLNELLATVLRAARGEALCSPLIAASLFRRVADLATGADQSPLPPSTPAALTARELDVIVLIQEGCSNKQIARQLDISLATVKNHVHTILEKLGASSRGEAAARARQHAVGGAAVGVAAGRDGRSLVLDRSPIQ